MKSIFIVDKRPTPKEVVIHACNCIDGTLFSTDTYKDHAILVNGGDRGDYRIFEITNTEKCAELMDFDRDTEELVVEWAFDNDGMVVDITVEAI